MAASALVLSNPLCFLLRRYGKTAVNPLKNAVLDFYSVAELADAKRQLLEDASKLDTVCVIPHVPERREGELRATRIVDDIFVVLAWLDENLLMNLLPTYVADSPDAMPSTRLYDGDLAVLMKLLEKMGGQFGEFGSKLAAIFNDMQALRSTVTSLVQLSAGGDGEGAGPQPPPRSRSGNVQRDRPVSSDVNNATSLRCTPNVMGAESATTVAQQAISDSRSTGTDWATMAAMAASSPLPFTEVESKRSAKRRRYQSTQQVQQAQRVQQARQSGEQQPARDRRRRGGQVLRGRAASGARGLAAAKHIVDKAVFCVDNVDPKYEINDIKAFVSGLSVNVFTCFRVEPRRRRGEVGPITDRRAFRLCIAAADQDRLLDSRKWPDSVTISEWYYIDPADAERRRTTERRDQSASGATASLPSPVTTLASTSVARAAAGATSSMSASHSTSDDNAEDMMEDNEPTVLYIDAAPTAAV